MISSGFCHLARSGPSSRHEILGPEERWLLLRRAGLGSEPRRLKDLQPHTSREEARNDRSPHADAGVHAHFFPAMPGARHRFRGKDPIELGSIEEPALEHDIANRPSRSYGLLGDLSGRSVPDVRAERRGHRGAAVEQLPASLGVGLDPVHAPRAQRLHRFSKDRRRVDRVPRDDRHHHIELELPGLGSGADGHVAADDLKAHLVDHLRYRRIHFAGHDR